MTADYQLLVLSCFWLLLIIIVQFFTWKIIYLCIFTQQNNISR